MEGPLSERTSANSEERVSLNFLDLRCGFDPSDGEQLEVPANTEADGFAYVKSNNTKPPFGKQARF